MKWEGLMVILLLFTSSFAAPPIVESGDGGAQFAIDTVDAKCQEANVQAVYKCLGNVVRVISALEGEGSTFYKPDGKVVRCPVAAPTEMGAECLQMMTPNYCPVQAECGNAPAPQVFPGQNDTPEQEGDLDYYVIEGEAASEGMDEEPIPEPEPYIPKPKKEEPPQLVNEEEDIPAATENKTDSLLGSLSIVILLLGMVAVGVLFMLFKQSIQE